MAERRVTVFGGTGFLGRQIAQHLLADGWSVRIAARRPDRIWTGWPGNHGNLFAATTADVRDPESVAEALDGVNAAVNAVGLYVERGNETFRAIHVKGARNIAEQAFARGLDRLIHISGIGVNFDSASRYVRARAQGEDAVSLACPDATILRPSALFGPADALVSTLAGIARFSPVIPLFGGGRSTIQPVYVEDMARAVVRCLDRPKTKGRTYELGGPNVYTYKALTKLILKETGRRRLLLPLPFGLAAFMAQLCRLLPQPPLTVDQIELMKPDNVVGKHAHGLAELEIQPTPLETILPEYESLQR